MNNYEFCAQWVLERCDSPSARVLDYGCGAGQIVNALLAGGVDAFGCDVFYGGGDYSQAVDSTLFENRRVRRMECNTIPFDNESFDFVTNNQVMEHVPDFDAVLTEIWRVLKPRGMVLSLFPDKSVWREGHCGVPFLHWFPKGSRARLYFATAFRSVGFGKHHGSRGILEWSRHFCEYLDDWTHYRTRSEIEAAYGRLFGEISYIEDYWLRKRLERGSRLLAIVPTGMQRLIVNKLGGLVFVARKPDRQ